MERYPRHRGPIVNSLIIALSLLLMAFATHLVVVFFMYRAVMEQLVRLNANICSEPEMSMPEDLLEQMKALNAVLTNQKDETEITVFNSAVQN